MAQKIVDTFCFFNELTILECRLSMLYKHVDYFVLVEGTRTHSNKKKPLFFEENKERFSKFLPKIIHVIVEDENYPCYTDTWNFEHFQRNCIATGLKKLNLKDDDIVMFSDVDEIPDHHVFDKSIRLLEDYSSVIYNNKLFYCYFNLKCKNEASFFWNPWTFFNTRMMKYGTAKYLSADEARRFNDGIIIKDSGWHFSFMNTFDNIVYKLESFAHQEYNKPEYKDMETMKQRALAGHDILGRDFQFAKCKKLELPNYILHNQDKYKHLILE